MEVIGFLALWFALGIAVVFVAFSGGPGRARQAYLTRGNRGARILFPAIYLALGLIVPAIVIANREDAVGSSGELATTEASGELARGKDLFRQTCASCHSLKAANAVGVTGPNLDALGQVNEQRVLSAIENGGTGQLRMPRDLLEGENARAVAKYVAATAGK